MVEDLTNKTISDLASDSESSLSLLPRKELSNVQNRESQRLAAYAYRKEEEHTFIQSKEIDNEDQDS